MGTTFICFLMRIWIHRQLWKTSLVFKQMHSNQYILKVNICQTLTTVIWREILILNDWKHRLVWMWRYVSLSEMERIICHKWDILEEKLDVENIDCEIQHGYFDVTWILQYWQPPMLHSCFGLNENIIGTASFSQLLILTFISYKSSLWSSLTLCE